LPEEIITNIELWGLPVTITQYGAVYDDVNKLNKKQLIKLYIGLSGLITYKQVKQFNPYTFKKPLKLVHQINMIQVNMAKNIWNSRNLFVHNNKTASPRA
jgi:hypothetical protein